MKRSRCAVLLPVLVVAALTIRESCAQCSGEACPRPTWRSPAAIPINAHLRSATCRVVVRGDAGRSFGSGTLVQSTSPSGWVLTCGHLFDERFSEIVVAFPDGGRFAARLAAYDRPNDLAVLQIAVPNAKPIDAVGSIRVGGSVVCAGYGGDGDYREVRGPVIGYATAVGASSPSLRIRGGVRSGDSGGPVLDTEGRLVGVVWGVRDGVTYAAFGEPVQRILARVGGRVAQRRRPPADRALPRRDQADGSASRLAAIESRLDKMTPCRCPNNVATRGDLAEFVTKNDLAKLATTADLSGAVQSLRTDAAQQTSRLTELRDQLLNRARSVAVEAVRERLSGLDLKAIALSKTHVVLASLGVGGPIGLAMLAGRLWLRSRRRRRRDASRGQGGPRRGPFRRR